MSIDVPMSELQHGYAGWALKHLRETGTKVILKLPYIELYDTSGSVTYHGDDPASNAEILKGLPKAVANLRKTPGTFPTLREMIVIIPELKPYERDLIGNNHGTLLAVTVLQGCERCLAQDRALSRIRGNSNEKGIRVIDLRLRK